MSIFLLKKKMFEGRRSFQTESYIISIYTSLQEALKNQSCPYMKNAFQYTVDDDDKMTYTFMTLYFFIISIIVCFEGSVLIIKYMILTYFYTQPFSLTQCISVI